MTNNTNVPISYDEIPLDTQEGHHQTEIVLFDKQHPRSVYNICPPKMQVCMNAIVPEIVAYNERRLKQLAHVCSTDNCLRLAFWQEYNRAQSTGTKVILTNVVHGITFREYFYEKVLMNPYKLMWMLTPPKGLSMMQEEVLHESLEKLREVTQQSIFTVTKKERRLKGGDIEKTVEKKLNVAGVAEVRKIAEMLSLRVQGAIIQRIAIKQQNIPIGYDETGMAEVMDEDELQKIHDNLMQIQKTMDVKLNKAALNVQHHDTEPPEQGTTIIRETGET